MTEIIYMELKVNNLFKRIEFRVTYREPAYVFCECDQYPAMRGFYTAPFLRENQVA